MAHARTETHIVGYREVEVTETILEPIERREVHLTLTHREAVVLTQLLQHIGGMEDSPRGQCETISDALRAAGYSPDDLPEECQEVKALMVRPLRTDGHGGTQIPSIYFRSYNTSQCADCTPDHEAF